MAFCVENSSFGRPWMFHVLILTGLPRTLVREKLSLQGIFSSLHFSTQFFMALSR